MSKSNAGIQVIARAAAILRALESEQNGLSLGQIAKRVELPRSTVQRIVSALTTENILISATPYARVKLGPAILRMAANTSFDIAKFVRPHLELLAQRTGETVNLSMQRGNQMVYIDQIETSHRLAVVSEVGESFLMHNSANGKAALALLEDDAIVKLFEGDLMKGASDAATSVAELLKEIGAIRETDFAFDNEERTEGISVIGTAFHDPLGRAFSVSVQLPSLRFIKSKDTLVTAMKNFRAELLASMSG